MQRVALLIVFWLVSGSNLLMLADERTELLRRVKASRFDFSQQFNGQKIRGELVAQKSGIESHVCSFEFVRLSKNIWRFDSTTHDRTETFCQNESLSFEAAKGADGKYRYTLAGYDLKTSHSIKESVLARNHLSLLSTHVFSIDLVDFLSIPTLKILSNASIQTEEGLNAERIQWECEAHTPTMPRSSFGEIIVLPEHGFQIEFASFSFGTRNTPSPPATFVFETKFGSHGGKLEPVETRKSEPGITYICKLVSCLPTIEESSYFEPESIGLSRPLHPGRFRPLWWGLGIAFAVLVLYSLSKSSSMR